ncbi:MAG: zinc ABC transporter substrate-binding protein [Bacillota bacterium]|nr:zinc ABC transporter substrate-binding protein [Bacillota bacterium]
MLKKIMLFSIITCSFAFFSACSSKTANAQKDPSKVQISVTFNALGELAEAVGKDKVQVTVMTPDGMEPHDFEPKAKDLEALSDGNVFVYNGLGMEAWVEQTLEAVGNDKLEVVEASKGFDPIKNKDTAESADYGQYDPHLWLSLKGAENAAKNIRDALIKADPSNTDYYEKNYQDFSDVLDSLYGEYSLKFKEVSNKSFVTGHAAFAYLCRDFGLTQNSVEDVFADGEPSAKKLKQLADYCRERGIKTVFAEDLVSPRVSETLAVEVGAKIEKIYTLESKEDNKDYIQSMKDNLERIYLSLK